METSRETDNDVVMQASAQVLTDPMLLRCISSFHRVIPMPLYTFWASRNPPMVPFVSGGFVWPSYFYHHIQRVVQYGTPELLDLIPLVCVYFDNEWRTPSLKDVPLLAIGANRPDMLEWMILHHAITEPTEDLWRKAVQLSRDGDLRVLQVLHRYKPISDQQMRGLTKGLKDTALVGWIATNFPEAFDPEVMIQAAFDGNLELVQCLQQHLPTTNWGIDPYLNALRIGHVEILMYLLEKRPHDIDTKLVGYFIQDYYRQALATFKGSTAFREPVRELATGYAQFGNLRSLQRVYDIEWLGEGVTLSIDQAAAKGELDCIKFLVERGLAAATTDAMDLAAEAKKWDVVYYLHEQGIGGCTTRVMDAAAAEGELDHVKFFHENRSEGCTTRAMDEAASKRHLEVVRFLHEHRSEGCTTRAMDEAACEGHLDVVRFLHENRLEGCTTYAMDKAAWYNDLQMVSFLHKNRSEGCTTRAMDGAVECNCLHVIQYLHMNRTEGCTTDAMDDAAKRGLTRVVEYLQRHRSEGCTKAAVDNALNSGHLVISRLLYKHHPSFFGPEHLHDLLLRGLFDAWMDLRAMYPDEANAVVEPVLFEAGKTYEIATIRFIIHELGRDDIAHTAVDGAASIFARGKSDWLRAVIAVAGPGSCRLSAVRNAVESRFRFEPAIHLQYVISVCSETISHRVGSALTEIGAHELVVSMMKEDLKKQSTRHMRAPLEPSLMDVESRIAVEIEEWNPEKEPLVLPPLHPILADATSPGWAVVKCLRSIHERMPHQVPWACQAINHCDHEMLQHLVACGASVAESFTGDKLEFSFEGARATAARVGSLEDLQLLLSKVDLPVEPTLLDAALQNDQFEIAEWLVEHCRDGCQSLPSAASTSVWWESDGIALDWIDSHAAVQEFIDFGAIAYQAVECGNLLALEQLFSRYPEVFTTRTDLAKPAVEKGHQEVLDFLAKIQYAYLPPSSAVQVEDSTPAL